MKKTYKYIALAVLTLGFTACSQDDDFTPQQEDIVKIASANIATEVQTRVNTLDDGTKWENGDQILLVNNSRSTKNSGTYTVTINGETATWSLSSGTVLYASGTSDFKAYYPASVDFTLPTDQSTKDGIKSADRMVATATGVAKGAAVTLSFERQHAKVTITPTFASEYDGKGIADIQNFKIEEITPYLPENGTAYTAILEPSETGFAVTLTVGSDNLTATSTTALEAGKHYTFNLTVGKEAVSISSVSVNDWTEKPITNVESGEYFLPVDATAMSAEELKDAVVKILNVRQSDVTVTLAPDADTEMFTALRTAFAESTVPDGSINLTIAGVKTIPDYAFINFEEYFENEKNIAGDKLKSLALTDAETIGEEAFNACRNLTSLNIPKATTIKAFAFGACSSLTSVDLTKVVTLGNGAFGNCDLRTLVLSEATSIDGGAFEYNKNLVSCSAPKATYIGYYPWGNCEKLETLELSSAGTFTLENNLFAYTPTGQIKLVLNRDKENEVTENEDGTATWKTKNNYNGNLTYTFKSIDFVD